MSSLLHPSQHLSQHLSDPTLNPLLTTASSQPTLESLTALAATSLTASTTLTHLSLGPPLRILVEYAPIPSPATSTTSDPASAHSSTTSGPILLQSFIHPPARHDHEEPPAGLIEEAPVLIATVVGESGEHTVEARRAMRRLERIATEFQKEWVEEETRVVEGVQRTGVDES